MRGEATATPPPILGQARTTRCGGTTFVWGARTYVMGIVNVTPDSFSGDGLLDSAAAIAHGLRLAEDGADILDVGGESTRPGARPVDADEERRCVVPVVDGLSRQTALPISVDTYRSETAEAALAAGAVMVNDVWGFRCDPTLASVVAQHGACAVATHNRRAAAAKDQQAGGYFPKVEYADLLADIVAGLRESTEILVSAGVSRERIIVDPGIGFGKTPKQNLELLRRLGELRVLDLPVDRPVCKSFIGLALGLPPDQRVEGTATTVALGIGNGADIVRVHDLPAMARVARMADAIVRGPAE